MAEESLTMSCRISQSHGDFRASLLNCRADARSFYLAPVSILRTQCHRYVDTNSRIFFIVDMKLLLIWQRSTFRQNGWFCYVVSLVCQFYMHRCQPRENIYFNNILVYSSVFRSDSRKCTQYFTEHVGSMFF